MRLFIRRLEAGAGVLILLTAACGSIFAQTDLAPFADSAPAAPATPMAVGMQGLRPAMAQIGGALAGLRIDHWKGSSALRSSTRDDVASIQRDLTGTLPSLIVQAHASTLPSGPLAPALLVFRNVDALYDVLLRVSETASLIAPSEDAAKLEAARSSLESARRQLGDALVSSAGTQDLELAHLRAEAAAAPSKPAAPPPTIVIDDGPAPAAARHKSKKPVAKGHTTTQPHP